MLPMVPQLKPCYTLSKPSGGRQGFTASTVGLYLTPGGFALPRRATDKQKAQMRAYNLAHAEDIKRQRAVYYTVHREDLIAYQVAYNATHREVRQLSKTRRRARQRGLPSTLTAVQWTAIMAAYKHRCAYCGNKTRLTQDHVIPVARNGGTTCDNIVPACLPCNFHKNAGAPPMLPALRLML